MDDGAATQTLTRTESTSNSSGSSRRSSDLARRNSKRKHSTQTPSSTLRKRPSGLHEERSLTSFPSLSPETSPNVDRSNTKSTSRGPRTKAGQEEDGTRKIRTNLVETLMNSATAFGSAKARNTLFADSPATTVQDVPGALHHASDDHIRRVMARRGAVQLVRQLASDLAQREAEMTTLRLRAEARERELKKMLREVEVGNLDIERRLHRLEETPAVIAGEAMQKDGSTTAGVGALVGQAIGDDLTAEDEETFLAEGPSTKTDRQATIRASSRKPDNASVSSSIESGKKGWMSYFTGSSNTVRKQPRGISPAFQDRGVNAAQTAVPSVRRKGIEETLFQPPSQDEIGSTSMSRTASAASDQAAKRASRSSWTMKLFAGAQTAKEADAQSTSRGRSSTTASDMARDANEISPGSRHIAETTGAVANSRKAGQRRSIHALSINARNADVRSISSMPLNSPTSMNPPENLGPVEMDAILPHGSRPPTLAQSYEGDSHSDVLTDRFGFIYDQRRRKREADALAKTSADQQSETATASPDFPEMSDVDSLGRSSTPTSVEEAVEEEVAADTASGPVRRWNDWLSIASLPTTELLSHTPSATIAPVAKASSKKTLKRMPTFGEEVTSPNPAPSPSTITANKAEIAKPLLSGPSTAKSTHTDTEPVKLLLAQLTELHDKLQREKIVKWNEFLRKVRAERRREGEQAGIGEPKTRKPLDLPEASIADGEIIGISSLGHKGKVGRAKYREFKSLVLGGIPIVHRAKIWSECSGANALRNPGYYQDLVANRHNADPTVLAQIDLDINRTLTDNVFFRSGPGVAKLKEILIAYSQHNVEVNYCQGLNMIVGALLLIMPTTEDVFWLLATIVENILPRRYYDNSLLASRADQQVLRSYVAELLPKLSAHLDDLSVELEALTFQWFLSVFTDCLTAEALYRVWDVLLCLASDDGNGGSTFLFQVALALLKLNEQQLLACETPGEVYTYLGGEITNHAISIDGLIRASEGLKALVKRKDVEDRREKWVLIEEETIREREAIRNGKLLKSRRNVAAEA